MRNKLWRPRLLCGSALKLGLSAFFVWALSAPGTLAQEPEWKVLENMHVRSSWSVQQRVIENQLQFEQLWLKWRGKDPMPKIDFMQHALIWVMAGKRPTRAHQYCVQSIEARSGTRWVKLRETRPAADAFVPFEPNNPGCLVQIPRSWLGSLQFHSETPNQVSGSQLPMKTLSQQSNSLVTEARQVLIRDDAAFELLWRQHQGSLELLPDVDFERDMVVAVFLGEQPTGGYEVSITEVAESDSGIRVYYSVTEPHPDFMVIQMLTAPVHMIVVPAREGEIQFIQQED